MYRDDINETTNISYQNLDRHLNLPKLPLYPTPTSARLGICMYSAAGIPNGRIAQDSGMHRTISNDFLLLQHSG
jgi:hypothetical protein